ncbi:tyrosine-protein phosphatase non-receptor type 20 isoform X2 [Piliocolobus tephrosceles]|uniref:Protein tyrosine phosphatase non-receptor type 20 n=2 Tax=Piliocolobus tephrosceles TaxID=591936 RepID=A0A8C9HJZ0_9PRIM|nr:tyrosine-protein phosphatase non-receptor type 20 isoform X2 [Piliocolobus tephrosceles]
MIIKDSEGNDSEAEDLNFRETLPSSSKKNTPRSKVFENEVNSEKVKPSLRNFPRNDYEDVFEEPSESGSDPSMWTARGPFRRDRWSSENEEPAGPSQALSPLLSDMHKIVSEGELHQLAQIRPLIFNFHEQTAIKDCLKMLEKKTGAYDIMQEFMTGTSHSVKQLQFIKWPDHGTPASADSFIKYVRYARKSHFTGPMVVHCSAGIGRTGVFLCADVVFCAIVKNCSFNIMDIVAQMREQRSGMVQTKEQYHFCYDIVLKVLRKLLTLD